MLPLRFLLPSRSALVGLTSANCQQSSRDRSASPSARPWHAVAGASADRRLLLRPHTELPAAMPLTAEQQRGVAPYEHKVRGGSALTAALSASAASARSIASGTECSSSATSGSMALGGFGSGYDRASPSSPHSEGSLARAHSSKRSRLSSLLSCFGSGEGQPGQGEVPPPPGRHRAATGPLPPRPTSPHPFAQQPRLSQRWRTVPACWVLRWASAPASTGSTLRCHRRSVRSRRLTPAG